MRGGNLRADACAAMWNDRIKEANHIDAFLNIRAANFCDFAASPIMMRTIECTPGLIVRPRSVSAARKHFVFSSSLPRRSVDALRSSNAFREAATTGGAMVLENR